jgi:transcriptional regulator with XRE-family HTH domain
MKSRVPTEQKMTNIEKYRRLRGLTQSELGQRIGKSHARICEYEHGANIPIHTLYDIASVLGIDTGDVFAQKPCEEPATPHAS